MIPRILSDIEWADVLRLIELSREEDDRIEFKSSFKGSDDYAALSDKQRQQVLDSIAREAVAFLNTRGGDIIVGVKESDDQRPAAAGIEPIKDPADAADRIARGLSALIEPAQTNIAVRGLSNPKNSAEGVVIARVQASVRAPHRSKRTLECYARRGSESVPMAMDEIQDLTINRTRLRLEQMEFLDRQFEDFRAGKIEHRDLGDEVFHVRTVVTPTLEQSFSLDDVVLGALGNRDPVFYDSNGRAIQNDVAFRSLHSRWQPVLRGKKQEYFEEYKGEQFKDFQCARKILKESGVCIFDYAVDSHFDSEVPTVHAEWLIGYIGQIIENLRRLSEVQPSAFPCVVRIGIRSRGGMHFAYGSGMWAQKKAFPQGAFYLPDFTLSSTADLDGFFQQSQVDLFSLVNVSQESPYTLLKPEPAK
jgi:hypothetical protein